MSHLLNLVRTPNVWWTQSLTDLRKQSTLLRNRFQCARKYNKPDLAVGKLEKQAWVAKHSYFKELRRQKKTTLGRFFRRCG